MEHTRIVLGQGAEAYREHHLTVVTVGVVEDCAGSLVLKLPVAGVQHGDFPAPNHAEAVDHRTDG